MTRETISEKSGRYIAERRLVLTRVTRYSVRATVRGEVVYTVRFRFGAWSCTCPARVRSCCHIVATKTVTAPKRSRWRPW